MTGPIERRRPVHLDTHVAAWIFDGDARRLRPVGAILDASNLLISPAAVLELQFLFEVGRVAQSAGRIVDDLASRFGISVSDAPFADVVRRAMEQTWTRDPFDRLIVGAALADDAPLLTSDATIQAHCRIARWR